MTVIIFILSCPHEIYRLKCKQKLRYVMGRDNSIKAETRDYRVKAVFWSDLTTVSLGFDNTWYLAVNFTYKPVYTLDVKEFFCESTWEPIQRFLMKCLWWENWTCLWTSCFVADFRERSDQNSDSHILGWAKIKRELITYSKEKSKENSAAESKTKNKEDETSPMNPPKSPATGRKNLDVVNNNNHYNSSDRKRTMRLLILGQDGVGKSGSVSAYLGLFCFIMSFFKKFRPRS